MQNFRIGLESLRQNRDRDGRGLGFKVGFREVRRLSGTLDDPGSPFPGVPDTGLTASVSAVPKVTAAATLAMVVTSWPFNCIALDWSGTGRPDHPVDGGADETESVRPSFTIELRIDGGVEDDDDEQLTSWDDDDDDETEYWAASKRADFGARRGAGAASSTSSLAVSYSSSVVDEIFRRGGKTESAAFSLNTPAFSCLSFTKVSLAGEDTSRREGLSGLKSPWIIASRDAPIFSTQ